MKALREKVTRSLYVVTLAVAMIGWMLALSQGLEWNVGRLAPDKAPFETGRA